MLTHLCIITYHTPNPRRRPGTRYLRRGLTGWCWEWRRENGHLLLPMESTHASDYRNICWSTSSIAAASLEHLNWTSKLHHNCQVSAQVTWKGVPQRLAVWFNLARACVCTRMPTIGEITLPRREKRNSSPIPLSRRLRASWRLCHPILVKLHLYVSFASGCRQPQGRSPGDGGMG